MYERARVVFLEAGRKREGVCLLRERELRRQRDGGSNMATGPSPSKKGNIFMTYGLSATKDTDDDQHDEGGKKFGCAMLSPSISGTGCFFVRVVSPLGRCYKDDPV